MTVPGCLTAGLLATGAVVGSYLGHAVDQSLLTVHNFSGKSLGAASSDRVIVVAVGGAIGDAGTAVSSVTVGGVSATKAAAVTNSTRTRAEIWVATVPTGTTGDIVVTWSAAVADTGINWWRLTGAKSTAFDTGSDTSTGSETALTTTLDIPATGFAVGLAANNDSAAARSFVWSELTEETGSDETVQGTMTEAAASRAVGAALVGQTITATMNAGSGSGAMVLASFEPA